MHRSSSIINQTDRGEIKNMDHDLSFEQERHHDLEHDDDHHHHHNNKRGLGIPMEILEELDVEAKRVLEKLVHKLEEKTETSIDHEPDEGSRSAGNFVSDWLDKFLTSARGRGDDHSEKDGEGSNGIIDRGLDPGEAALVSKLDRFKVKTLDLELEGDLDHGKNLKPPQ
ncbi:hypothetical protein Dimus_007038 [Dionaea muscipula]